MCVCVCMFFFAGQEKAFGEEGLKKLTNYGYVQFFRSGEYHHNSPLLMKTLHKVRRQPIPQQQISTERTYNLERTTLYATQSESDKT